MRSAKPSPFTSALRQLPNPTEGTPDQELLMKPLGFESHTAGAPAEQVVAMSARPSPSKSPRESPPRGLPYSSVHRLSTGTGAENPVPVGYLTWIAPPVTTQAREPQESASRSALA